MDVAGVALTVDLVVELVVRGCADVEELAYQSVTVAAEGLSGFCPITRYSVIVPFLIFFNETWGLAFAGANGDTCPMSSDSPRSS